MRQIRWNKTVAGAIAGSLITLVSSVQAQSGDAILDLLIKKGVINQREANEVREQLDKQNAETVELLNKTKASSWLDSLTWSGDLRLRGEYFSNENDLNLSDRTRFRYRLRLGLEAKFVEWATVNVRLASGDGDPNSTNQSLTDTFRKKPITIDVASVTLQLPGNDTIKMIGGKMDIPIWQPKFNSPMVYDFDDTPEGIAEQVQWKFGDKEQYRLFGNFGQFATKEFSKDANDAYLLDFQGGVEAKFGGEDVVKKPKFKVTAAGGYYTTLNLANKTSNGFYAVGDSPNLGNATQTYVAGGKTNTIALADFNVVNARGEAVWAISEKPFLGTPVQLTVSGEYLKNLKATYENLPDDQTEGWTVQVAFGEAKKKGQWQVAYQYKDIEADATWDALTDSDWGNGGTDRRGHVVKAAYNVLDWWQLGFAAIITEKISSRPNAGHNTVGINGEDQLRVQVDTVFKF